MSHDVLVATRMRPSPTAIEAYALTTGLELRVSGAFRTGSNALVARIENAVERTIDVDGPVRVEADDLPDDLAGVVSRPAWLVSIHLPGGFDAVRDGWALDLAIQIARDGDGAVFDPQVNRVAWPSGVTPRKRGSSEERIRTVELVWYVAPRRLPPDAPLRWLRLVADACPAALPVRFGAFEPFQGRLDRDGADGFAHAWHEQAAVASGGMLFWSAKSPGIGGSVSFADDRAGRRPERLGPVVRLSTTVDARPLHRDTRLADSVVDLLATVAAELGASYAAASVLRDAILRRGSVAYDSNSESVPMPRSRWWVGLPALPTWLAWFGEPYRGLVEQDLPASMVQVHPSGLLLRCAVEPADVDALQGVFPGLPTELLATRRSGAPVDPAVRVSMTSGPPSEPAATIPPLD